MTAADEAEARALIEEIKALVVQHGTEFDALLLRQRAELAAMNRQVEARLSSLAAE